MCTVYNTYSIIVHLYQSHPDYAWAHKLTGDFYANNRDADDRDRQMQ